MDGWIGGTRTTRLALAAAIFSKAWADTQLTGPNGIFSAPAVAAVAAAAVAARAKREYDLIAIQTNH